jgi:hypothetical protein
MPQEGDVTKAGATMSSRAAAQEPRPCVVIDQHDIDAPGFPRPQAWWDHFMPHGWTWVRVQDDGLVLVGVSGQADPSQGPHPAAAVQRNQESALIAWLARNPRLEVAIVEDCGEPCQCWRQSCIPHGGHCCFTDARVCHANPKIVRREAALARRRLRYAIRFAIESDVEPTDANLRRMLDRCVRPARASEYPEIRRLVIAYRANPAEVGQ